MMDKFTMEDKVEMLEPFDLSVYVVVKQPAGRQLYCDAYCVKGKIQLGRQSTKFCYMATLAFLNITFLSLTNELGSTAEFKITVLTAFGMPGVHVNGMDVLKFRKVTMGAIRRARRS
nr:hypothetical protein [Tanacetum cinerariifolium]